MSASAILEGLECSRGGCECHRSVQRGRGNVHCPVHDPSRMDRTPSLGVTEGRDKPLWICRNGCDQDAVTAELQRLGLVHSIRDRDGNVLAWHERKSRWLLPDGTIGLNGQKPTDMLYGVEELKERPDEPVVLVEGEKARDALHRFGALAVASVCGAASTPSVEALRHLTGRDVLVWPDADEIGRVHMQRIGTILIELDVEGVRWVNPPEGVPSGWDAADASIEEVHALLDAAKRWQPPEQPHVSTAVTDWPAPLEDEAFHGLAGQIVRAIRPHTEADPAAILLQFLVGYGSMIGRHAHFVAESDQHFTNLFAVQVGETSKGRKGTSWGRVRWLLEQVDPVWTDTRIVGGLSSGEGLINEVRDPKTDKNGTVIEAGVDDKRLLVYEAEFSVVLKQSARTGNILPATIRQAWDSGDLRNLVVMNPRRATGAHISVIGHISKDELLRQLTETDAANGFGNRFLWYCSRRSQLLPDGGGLPAFGDIVGRLCASVAFAQSAGEIGRDAEARVIWHKVYGPLSEGKPGLLGSMIARAEAQAMRLAVIYAVLDCSPVVTKDHLLAGLAAWQYCEDSARYIFGERLGDPTADTILAALREHRDGLTRTQIYVELFGKHKPTEEIARALDSLLARHLVRVETVETRGRPAEVWVAV
jgi:hypothetical protein